MPPHHHNKRSRASYKWCERQRKDYERWIRSSDWMGNTKGMKVGYWKTSILKNSERRLMTYDVGGCRCEMIRARASTQEAYAKRSFPCLYTVNLSDILPRFRISLQNSFQLKLDMPCSCWKTNKEELRPTRSEMIEWVKLNHFTDSKEQTAEMVLASESKNNTTNRLTNIFR